MGMSHWHGDMPSVWRYAVGNMPSVWGYLPWVSGHADGMGMHRSYGIRRWYWDLPLVLGSAVGMGLALTEKVNIGERLAA